jgi:hypothetical protein
MDAVNALEESPALRARLGRLFGIAGEAVVDRAVADVRAGRWGTREQAPAELHYAARQTAHGYHVEAVAPLTSGLRARVLNTGGAIVTNTVDGKLQASHSWPSALRMDDEGELTQAVWHDAGRPVCTWHGGDPQSRLDAPAEAAAPQR